MQQTVTAKIRLRVTLEQSALLDKTMEQYRLACDFVSDYVFESHNLQPYSIQEAVYSETRKRFALKSQMTISVFRTVAARYKTILENQKEWIKPKFSLPQLDLVWNRDYSLVKDVFSIATIEDRIKVPFFQKGMEKYFDKSVYKFGTAKLVKRKDRFFLHIPVTREVKEVTRADIKNVVGVDRGLNFIVATYDSQQKSTFVNGKFIKEKRAHFKELRSELQQKRTPSSRRRLKKIGQRETRWMQDVNHCVSKALVDDQPESTVFVLEDLTGIRESTEKVRKKDRYVQVSWAYYDLEKKIEYKAALKGDVVIKVDRSYTSQRCPKCGHTDKHNRNRKKHLFCCRNCGYKSNDDRIGAMNLYHMGLEWFKNGTVASRHDRDVRGAVNRPTMQHQQPVQTDCKKGRRLNQRSLLDSCKPTPFRGG